MGELEVVPIYKGHIRIGWRIDDVVVIGERIVAGRW